MAGKYRQFLRLTEQWPVDPTKSNKRDLGKLLRKKISQEFSQGENTVIRDPAKCDKMYESLKNIADNKYKNKYPWTRTTGCVGAPYDLVHYGVSEEGLKVINEDSAGFVKKTLTKMKRKFSRSKSEEKSEN